MTDQIAELAHETSVEAPASEAIPEQKPTSEDPEAIWRKRQAGADAARAAAEKELADARKELAKYRQIERESQDANLSAEAKLQADLEYAKKSAADAEAKFEAKYLDRTFPKARAKFPEIRDEVRLAELEALYGDAPATAPAPQAPTDDLRAMRAPKDASGSKTAEESLDDAWARFRNTPAPASYSRQQ